VDEASKPPHPPSVVKIEAGREIKYTQIVSVSALMGLHHCIDRESSLRHSPFPVVTFA